MMEQEKPSSVEIYKVAAKHGPWAAKLVDTPFTIGEQSGFSFSDLFSTIENLEKVLDCFGLVEEKHRRELIDECLRWNTEEELLKFVELVLKPLKKSKVKKETPESVAQDFVIGVCGVFPEGEAPGDMVIHHKLDFGERSEPRKSSSPEEKEAQSWESLKESWEKIQKEQKKGEEGFKEIIDFSSRFIDDEIDWEKCEEKIGATEEAYFNVFKIMKERIIVDKFLHKSWITQVCVVAKNILSAEEQKKEIEAFMKEYVQSKRSY